MKFLIDKNSLTKSLSLALSIVQRKTTMPILSNFLLSVKGTTLKIIATNLEISCITNIPIETSKEGSITVNAKMLSEIVRELPEGNISFDLMSDDRLEIHAGKAKFKLVGVSADEFPGVSDFKLGSSSKVPAKVLSEMLGKSLYSVSDDETRFVLNGVCFFYDSGKLKMVGTDGHRLSLIEREISTLNLPETGEIVPKRGLIEAKKILDENIDSEVLVGFEEGMFILDAGSTKLSIRLVDGEFPDYTQVIPEAKGYDISIAKSQLEQSIKRVTLLVSDKSKRVTMDFSNGMIKMSGSSPELGEGTDEIEIDYKSDPLTVGFNGKYILDVLSSINEDQNVIIELHGSTGPAIFKIESDSNYKSFLMPIRLN